MSRERKEAKVYCGKMTTRQSRNERNRGGRDELTLDRRVEIMIAFGMTNAVIFLSIRRISEKGMTI